MRKSFINTLTEMAKKDERIFLLSADLGFSFLEDFQKTFPDRFINMGVAEQNMIGVAAGLALSGKIVFVYSIVPFVTMRCFEQVRNDVCFQNLNVRMIGIGGGVAYGNAGSTHHALEDIAIMRPLANLSVIAPGDPVEVEAAVRFSIAHKGPIYIRLGKGNEPVIHDPGKINIAKGIVLEKGKDITLISCGSMLYTAKQVASILSNKGISVQLTSMPMIKPLDREMIIKTARTTKAIFTIEEHGIIGGLGSAVAEVLAGSGSNITFKAFAFSMEKMSRIGCQKFLLEDSGLSEKEIASKIIAAIDKKER